jgi:Xaa-Pro aminopeptidase
VVDFGTCWLGYQVDVTRMFAWGPPAEESLRAYQALQAIQVDLLPGLVPGADGQDLYRQTLVKAAELGVAEEFLGQGRARIRFVGHGVGLEISEPPYLAEGRPEILKAGQTLALELKMVLPGREAVGLENTLLVTPAGGRIITPADEAFGVLGG